MGSDDHYPEEAPSHRVRVDPFAIDASQVTNERYGEFVRATGYRTVAERALDPADYPDAPAENLVAGSLVFTPTAGPVDLRHISQWWTWTPGACWSSPEGPGSSVRRRPDHPVVHIAYEDAVAYAEWAAAAATDRGASGSTPLAAGLERATYTWGDEARPGGKIMANTWDGPDFPWRSTRRERVRHDSPGRHLPRQRLRPLRHGRQRLGVDFRLVDPAAPRRGRQALLPAARTRVAGTSRTATTPPSRSSGSGAA